MTAEHVTVATDGEWRASTGAIRAADLYDGAEIDLREEPDGWEMPGFEDASWAKAVEVPFDPGSSSLASHRRFASPPRSP